MDFFRNWTGDVLGEGRDLPRKHLRPAQPPDQTDEDQAERHVQSRGDQVDQEHALRGRVLEQPP